MYHNFLSTHLLISTWAVSKSWLQGQKAVPFLIFEKTLYFSQSGCTSLHSHSVRASLFFTSSPALAVCWLIDDSLCDRCQVISHCGFNLHLSDDYWCRASFHMSIGRPYVLFGEVSIQVLWPFFKCSVLCVCVCVCWVLQVFKINFGY